MSISLWMERPERPPLSWRRRSARDAPAKKPHLTQLILEEAAHLLDHHLVLLCDAVGVVQITTGVKGRVGEVEVPEPEPRVAVLWLSGNVVVEFRLAEAVVIESLGNGNIIDPAIVGGVGRELLLDI